MASVSETEKSHAPAVSSSPPPPTAPKAKPSDNGAAAGITEEQRNALAALHTMMPSIEMLVRKANIHKVNCGLGQLRTAVNTSVGELGIEIGEEKKTEKEAPKRKPRPFSERDQRLMDWSRGTKVHASSPYEVQGKLIEQSMTFAVMTAKKEVDFESPPEPLNERMLRRTIYALLKGAAKIYDPGAHGQSFAVFIEPIMRSGMKMCVAEKKMVEKPSAELIVQLSQSENSPEQTEAAKRDEKLMQWVSGKSYSADTPYEVRGKMISACIQPMRTVADRLESGAKTIENADLATAGFRTLKCLVMAFDSELHGESFWKFAQPYVEAAIQHCVDEDALVIPNEPSWKFIESLHSNNHQAAESEPTEPVNSTEQTSKPPAEQPIDTVEQAEETLERITGAVEAEVAAQQADEPRSLTTVAEATEEVERMAVRHEPPAAEPVETIDEAESTGEEVSDPEEEAEAEDEEYDEPAAESEETQLDRFIAWAQRELDTPLISEPDRLAAAVAKEYENLMNGVAQKIKRPPSYKGGVKGLKKVAKHNAPKIIMTYDPESDGNFQQFLSEETRALLNEEAGVVE